MNHIQDMMDKLNAFESSNAIASFLIQNGIKGDMQDSDSCVITNWFLTETDAIGCSTTEAKINVEGADFKTWEMTPSEIVSTFIREFDDGRYPELINECRCEACTSYYDYEY